MTAPTLPRALPFDWGIASSVSSAVPGTYPCALNGRPLMIDDGAQAGWAHEGIQQIRQQADSSTLPSEQSLNPQGLWRRAQESWHRGAGQTYRDKTNTGQVYAGKVTSDDYRFNASKGVDPWTPFQLALLPTTVQKKAAAQTNLKLMTAGSRLYLASNQSIFYTTDMTSWSTASGTAAATITGLDSDGFNVYIGNGASGIYKTDTGSSAAASFVTGTVGIVAYVKGRLMCSNGGASIYNPTGAGALPAALFTHGNSAFTWVGFAEGDAAIYAAGFAGDKSLIYRIAVKPDGSALDSPIIAGQLPDGEIVRSISGYLGFIFIGTDSGVRFCEADAQGNLDIGPLIDLSIPIYCFEGQKQFVWFGWTGYDTVSTGLGRMDLTELTEDFVTGGRRPAYASDLMATGSGTILSVVTFLGLRVFAVSGDGVYAETTTKVASGTITSGQIGFGLPDAKTAVELVIATHPLLGSYSASVSYDRATTTPVGTNSSTGTTTGTFPTAYTSAETFEITLTLTRGSDTTTGPTLTRWTLKVSPGPNDGPAEYLMIPFLLYRTLRLPGGQDVFCDVQAERDAIKALREASTVVDFQDCDSTYQVTVENFQWNPLKLAYDPMTGNFRTPDGTMTVQLKRIS